LSIENSPGGDGKREGGKKLSTVKNLTGGCARAYRCSLVMERISPALIRMTPRSDFNEKFPESSFSAMCPATGFGNRPVSGRRVTLTRSPTASAFKEFANDCNIAIDPPIIFAFSFALVLLSPTA
jgi:hypothetical protein